MQRGRRWRFAHDTFEEYFAAGYLVSYFEMNEEWPPLEKWTGSQEAKEAFSEVIEFVREMMDGPSKDRLAGTDIPRRWRARLARGV